MELRHLRYFCAVAETLHFSRAAARLNLTQPALSRQIRDLEDEIGVSLFRRHGTQTTLTAAGERFLARARSILEDADEAVEEARSTGRRLRVGHYGTLWVDVFESQLRAFAKAHPKTPLELVESTPRELATALRRDEVDVALIGSVDPALRREFVTRPLREVAMMVAMAAGNPLAKRRRVALSDLAAASWIGWDDRGFPGRSALLVEAARAAGFRPRIVRTVDSIGSMFVAVATTDEIGYVLPMSKQLPHSGVVFTALKPPGIRFEMHAAWRKNGPRTELAAAFADALAVNAR